MSDELTQRVLRVLDELGVDGKETVCSAVMGEFRGAVEEVLEECARLVETSHTAHDLHEIAARIREQNRGLGRA